MKIKLNLGSGYRPHEDYWNIDNRECCSPDIVWDIVKNRLPFEDSSVEEVRAYDFLEHIPIGKTVAVIEEIYRVLCPGGKFEHFTPSTDGRGAFQDPTHVSFWNINSWLYFMDDLHRNLYGITAKFEGKNIDLFNHELKIVHTHGILYAVK